MSTVSFNNDEYDEDTFVSAASLVMNQGVGSSAGVSERGEIMRRLGQQYDGKRDIYDVLGYDQEIDADDYRAKFERQDIANRIVTLPANDTWRHRPVITDDGKTPQDAGDSQTEFEKQLQKLADSTRLFHYLRRLDICSGIGEYGVLFIGFNDNQPLDEPPNEGALKSTDDVAFYTPFAQDSVESWTLGKDADLDASNPRYNMPVEYSLNFGDIDDNENEDIKDVHWKRVIHVAEGKVESDLKGTPRLKPVYNRLQDREKVLGASAEMFWTGAAPKYQFDIKSDQSADIPDDELDRLDDQVQKLVHEMQSYIKTFNTDIEVLDGQEVDPSGVMNEIDQSIAGQTGIPKRILKGSEAAELASTQDRATWYGRIETRRHRLAEPGIIRPIIDRLKEIGIIKPPQGGTYTIEWPNLFELNELEEAEVMNERAQALSRAAPQGDTQAFGGAQEVIDFVVDGDKPDPDELDEEIRLPSEPSEDDPQEESGDDEEETDDETSSDGDSQ